MWILYLKDSFCFYLHVCEYACVCLCEYVHLSVGDEGGRRGHRSPGIGVQHGCAPSVLDAGKHSGAHAAELCLVLDGSLLNPPSLLWLWLGVRLLPVSTATCPRVLCRGTPCSLVFHRLFQRCLISFNSVNSQLLFSEFYLYFFLTHLTLQTKAELEDCSFRKAGPRHNCSVSYASVLVHWPWGFSFLHF